jgi:predicted RNA-binding protein YlqC (UPF0109 family)
MRDLVLHLVQPIVDHPEEVKVQVVEGEATVMLELSVHPEDRERVQGDNGRTLRSIRNVLSAAAGKRKATLDLVDEHSKAESEE